MSNNLKAGEYYGKVSNDQRTPSSVLLEVVHKHRVNLPKHSHEQAFFSFLLEGSYSETYRGKSFSYRPMTIWWHPPGILHKDEVGTSGGHFFNIEIQSQYLNQLLQVTNLPSDFNLRGGPLVWSAFRLYHEFKNWQTGSDLIAEGITLEMLGHSAQTQLRVGGRPPIWFKRVIEKLNDEFSSHHTVEDLAREAKVHPVHLATTFRRFQRKTIGDYLRQLRIARATQMLFDRDIPLAEIAVTVGFCDQSHFTRVFKRYVGLTPAVFRQTLSR